MAEEFTLTRFGVGLIDEDQISKLEYPEGACIDCQDVVWVPSGAMTKRRGLSKMHGTAWRNAAITKIAHWENSSGASYALVFSCISGTVSASIATVTTSGAVAEFSSISTPTTAWEPEITEPISVASMVGSAVMTYWGNIGTLLGWTGGSGASFYSASPSGARVVVGFGNYLFACNVLDSAGAQKRSRIQWCTSRNMGSWPSTYYMDLDAEDGDQITAAVVFQNKLIVFKKYKTYAVYWVGGELLFTSELISSNIGCVGPNAWAESGGKLYFIGSYGLYEFDGRSSPISIADHIQTTVNTMNILVSQTFEVDSDDENWQVWFNIATFTSGVKDLILAYDTRFKSFTKFNISAACIGGIDFGADLQYFHLPSSYSTYNTRIRDATGEKEGLLCVGTYDGFLVLYGLEDNDYGAPINGYWLSRWLDFEDPIVNKRIIRVTVLLERSGDYDLNFALYTNWNSEVPALTKTISLAGGLDVSLVERKIDFTCPFRSCQIKISTASTNTPFVVHRIIISYLKKGKTLVI